MLASSSTQTTIGVAAEYLKLYKSECEKRKIVADPTFLQYFQAAILREDPLTAIVFKNKRLSKEMCDVLSVLIPSQANPYLRIVDLEGCLSSDTMETIVEAVYKSFSIETLILRDCKQISAKTCHTLSEMLYNGHPLRSLDISYNDIEFKNFAIISHSLASPYCNLQVFRMSGLELSSDAIGDLSKQLHNQTSLLTLSLAEDEINDESASHIATLLAHTVPLPAADDDEAQQANETLSSSPSSPSSAQKKSGTLQRRDMLVVGTSQIVSLDLRYNLIADDGVFAIANSLRTNRTLLSLVLWSNKITHTGIGHLCTALKENQTLQNLDVGCNRLGGYGARHMDQLIRTNTVLTTIGLAMCELGNDDVVLISSALSTNSTLLRIDLRGNDKIKLKGILALQKALATNFTELTTPTTSHTSSSSSSSTSSTSSSSSASSSSSSPSSSSASSAVSATSGCMLQCVALDNATLLEKASGEERRQLHEALTAIAASCEHNIRAFVDANNAALKAAGLV